MSSALPLYDDIFRRLEKIRWKLSDIPYAEIDRAAVKPETLRFLRVNCLMELSSLYAERMFLRDFRGLPDFCQFTSVWYYEEMKHYLVLRDYLKFFGMEPDNSAFPELDVQLGSGSWPTTLAFHFCGELRLGMWYRRWADLAEEPVLSQIYGLISADEYRHASCYKQFMERAVEQEPELLLHFLNAAKWILINPDGDKHPTTMKTSEDKSEAVTDRIPDYDIFRQRIRNTIQEGDEQRLRRQVLQTLSRLSQRPLKTMLDLVKLTNELSATGKHLITS